MLSQTEGEERSEVVKWKGLRVLKLLGQTLSASEERMSEERMKSQVNNIGCGNESCRVIVLR